MLLNDLLWYGKVQTVHVLILNFVLKVNEMVYLLLVVFNIYVSLV